MSKKMASGNPTIETITSDPVIVEASDAEKTASDVQANSPIMEETREKDESLEDSMGNIAIVSPADQFHQPSRPNNPRSYIQSRSPLPTYRRQPSGEYLILSNTISLNNTLEETDVCVETIKGRHVYITSHDFHVADLQKLSWLFQFGVQDSWIQKPTSFLPGNAMQFDSPSRGRDRFDYYDDDLDRVPMARLGSALRIFKDDSDPLTSKVKFVTIATAKNDSGFFKIVISHSRQAAASDILNMIFNNHSVVFVGAVLRSVAIPAENPNKKARKLQPVKSVQDAENVDHGVIGVIC